MIPFALPRAVLALQGPDAVHFLDKLITNDLGRLRLDAPVYAGLLTPQGKVVADMLIWAAPEGGLLLETDPARGGDLLRRLTMFKLRANVRIDDVSAEYRAEAWLEAPPADAAPDPRHAALGWRRLRRGPAHEAPAAPGALEARRLMVGAPDLARDAAEEEVFALEALFEELNGVDFKKGCFPGQENVSRMKRRATTRRKFCPVRFTGETPDFMTPVLAGAAEIGTIRTGMEGRALALLRLDRARAALEQDEALTAGGRALTLDPPSWLIMPEAG